ncbi:prothoracicotropic hormone-like [Ptiloglossa arizonensis]|uniref:prothoracicotropic hormone-like n=1 Tax=Ptiloglossa arizonensis TaxID=3350558 RepID=UPI003F9F6986
MKILIACMILHELRVAESLLTNDPWHEEYQQQLDLETSRKIGDVPWYGKRLLDEQTDQQKRMVVAVDHHHQNEDSPCVHVVTRSVCSCQTEYDIVDLGEGHYPRYLTASRCKPKTCQNKFRSCKLLNYTVYVLKQREANELLPEDQSSDGSVLQEAPLPESLRYKWKLKPLSMPVACVLNTGNKRN